MSGGARVIDGSDDVTLVSQRTGQPDLVAPVTSVPVGKDQQWMFARSRRRVTHGSRADEHHIIANQLRGGGRCTGVPDNHFQCALILRVRQCRGLEADGAFLSECDSRQAGQQQGAKSYFQCRVFLDSVVLQERALQYARLGWNENNQVRIPYVDTRL